MTRAAIFLACLCTLSGCGGLALTFAGANLATVIHADKTIPDFAISAETEKNCSLLHAARNEPYCQSQAPDRAEVLADLAANRYCYRTLGRIDCYDRPDFAASGLTQVEFSAGYLARPRGGAPMAAKDVPAPVARNGQPAPVMAPVKASAKTPVEAPASTPAPAAAATAGPDDAAKAVAAPDAPEPNRASAALAQVPPLALEPGLGTY